MGRSSSHGKAEVKKGPWTREEDQKLLAYIEEHGHGSWRALPAKAGLQRCGKSCRLRWTNYLRPDIKRGKFSTQEEKAIIRLHALLGNRWSAIATHLPKRTDNEIKNYWNTRLKKRLTRMGIDPTTHKPKDNPAGSAQSRQAAVVSHMAQWETARLEAETRLVRESKLQLLHMKVTAHPAPPCLDVLRVYQAAVTQNGLFGSPSGCFSVNNTAASTVSTFGARGGALMENDAVCVNSFGECGIGKGKMDNSVQINLHEKNITGYNPMDHEYNLPGLMDLGSANCGGYNNSIGAYNVGDFDQDNKNYWNELLNLVGSPMDPPVF